MAEETTVLGHHKAKILIDQLFRAQMNYAFVEHNIFLVYNQLKEYLIQFENLKIATRQALAARVRPQPEPEALPKKRKRETTNPKVERFHIEVLAHSKNEHSTRLHVFISSLASSLVWEKFNKFVKHVEKVHDHCHDVLTEYYDVGTMGLIIDEIICSKTLNEYIQNRTNDLRLLDTSRAHNHNAVEHGLQEISKKIAAMVDELGTLRAGVDKLNVKVTKVMEELGICGLSDEQLVEKIQGLAFKVMTKHLIQGSPEQWEREIDELAHVYSAKRFPWLLTVLRHLQKLTLQEVDRHYALVPAMEEMNDGKPLL